MISTIVLTVIDLIKQLLSGNFDFLSQSEFTMMTFKVLTDDFYSV